MQLTLRKLAPALVVMTLALAGCKTAPTKSGAAATPDAAGQQQSSTQPATAAVVEFYVAQTQSGPGLVEVNLPDGKIYMQQQPVLTRADLTEAAALVDRQGANFVGLRFSDAGARKLNDVSSKNVGNMLALVIDRELIAAPRIGEPLNRGVLAFGVPSAQAASDIAAKTWWACRPARSRGTGRGCRDGSRPRRPGGIWATGRPRPRRLRRWRPGIWDWRSWKAPSEWFGADREWTPAMRAWREYGSQHRHYPYWYEGTLSTRRAVLARRVPLRESEV